MRLPAQRIFFHGSLKIFKILFGEFLQIRQIPDTIGRYTVFISGTEEWKDGFRSQ